LPILLQPAKGIELVEPPEIATVPEGLLNAITIRHDKQSNGAVRFAISLLNPNQTVAITYLGVAREDLISTPFLSVITIKRDWMQRDMTVMG
jgi:hypothetical protein